MSKFTDAIRDFKEKVDRKTDKVFSRSCRTISYKIADKTPVSKGKLLGSWTPSLNTRQTDYFRGGPSAWHILGKDERIEVENKAKAMSNIIPKIESKTVDLTKQDTYYFVNGVSYARQAEYEGWKLTGRYLMVTRSAQEWDLIVKEEAKLV